MIISKKITHNNLVKPRFNGFQKHHQSFYNKTLCVQEVEYLWFYNIYPLENSIIPLVNMSAQATGHYIKCVHQLQNLYFALTGEELKLLKDG